MEGNGGNQLYPCNSTFTVSYHDEIISEGVIVAALIAIIFMLCVFLIFLVGPLAWKYVRSKIPVSQKRINGRYETIERWMISKVSTLWVVCFVGGQILHKMIPQYDAMMTN